MQEDLPSGVSMDELASSSVNFQLTGEPLVSSSGGINIHMLSEFRREVWLMSGLEHANIVYLKGICTENLSMVMEYMEVCV
jgi:serine/threonine protein kinase